MGQIDSRAARLATGYDNEELNNDVVPKVHVSPAADLL